MEDLRHKEIVDILINKTRNDTIDWQQDDASLKVITNIGDYKVGVFRIEEDSLYSVQLPGTVCAELSFMERNNNVFDKISIYNTSSAEYKILSTLYDLAKSKASGASQKLDSIISTLKNLNNPQVAQG